MGLCAQQIAIIPGPGGPAIRLAIQLSDLAVPRAIRVDDRHDLRLAGLRFEVQEDHRKIPGRRPTWRLTGLPLEDHPLAIAGKIAGDQLAGLVVHIDHAVAIGIAHAEASARLLDLALRHGCGGGRTIVLLQRRQPRARLRGGGLVGEVAHNLLIYILRLLPQLLVAARQVQQRLGAHVAGSRLVRRDLLIGRDGGFQIAIHLFLRHGRLEFDRGPGLRVQRHDGELRKQARQYDDADNGGAAEQHGKDCRQCQRDVFDFFEFHDAPPGYESRMPHPCLRHSGIRSGSCMNLVWIS